MRFHLGAIPETPDFSPDETWRTLREPTPWVVQFLALPIGIAAAGIVLVLCFMITPPEKLTGTMSIPALVFLVVGIVVVHELIHAAVHP